MSKSSIDAQLAKLEAYEARGATWAISATAPA